MRLFRCMKKGCRFTFRAEPPALSDGDRTTFRRMRSGWFGPRHDESGRRWDWRADDGLSYTDCPKCGGTSKGHRVRGFVSDEPCGARCLNAKGFQCECSCGGKNHGAGHPTLAEVVAEQRARRLPALASAPGPRT